MEFLHLRGAGLAAGQRLLGGRQRFMQRDHQRVFAEDDGHRLGGVAGSLLLERSCGLRDLFCHG